MTRIKILQCIIAGVLALIFFASGMFHLFKEEVALATAIISFILGLIFAVFTAHTYYNRDHKPKERSWIDMR